MSVWAVVFGVIGTAWPISLTLFRALPRYPLGIVLRILAETFVLFGLYGAVMGFAFATAVLLGERKRTLVALSPRRFAAWGFLSGAIVPIGIAIVAQLTSRSSESFNRQTGLIFAGISGVVGAGLAAATLGAARRPPASLDEENPRTRVPAG